MRRAAPALLAAALLGGLLACEGGEPSPPAAPAAAAAESVEVGIAGARFHLELAADAAARYRGLSGRDHVPANSGMLFAFPDSAPRAFVMRDCRVPLDLAFLDEIGRVLAVHAMSVEPPRRPDESPLAYERRLPAYASGAPARFAVETAGGRLLALGLRPGDQILLDHEALARRAR